MTRLVALEEGVALTEDFVEAFSDGVHGYC